MLARVSAPRWLAIASGPEHVAASAAEGVRGQVDLEAVLGELALDETPDVVREPRATGVRGHARDEHQPAPLVRAVLLQPRFDALERHRECVARQFSDHLAGEIGHELG
jgi:hypothetical protein